MGTLNLLGDVDNPFEFASVDKSLSASHKKLQDRARVLTWEDFALTSGDILLELARRSGPTLDALHVYCSSREGRSVWSFFMHLDHPPDAHTGDRMLEPRINCLTFALRGFKTEGSAQWQMLDYWQTELEELITRSGDGSPYKQDPRLIVWDMACNVVCSLEAQAHRTVCTQSYLHPDKCATLAQKLLWAARNRAGQQPLILGVQQWPQRGTARERAFQKLLPQFDYGVCVGGVAAPSVALIYSRTELGEPKKYDTDLLGPALMRQCLDEAIAQGEELDLHGPIAHELLSTTATRVLLVRFPRARTPLSRTRFLVMHASEPKDALTARLLARFALAFARHIECGPMAAAPGSANGAMMAGSPNLYMAGSPSAACVGTGNATSNTSDANFDPVGRPLVTLADCSLGSADLAEAFRNEANSLSYDSLPEPHIATSATHYSLLHGQCHDTTKCMTVALAPKDKIMAPRDTLRYTHVFPELGEVPSSKREGGGGKGVELPLPAWPTDHALTTVVYTPVPVIKPVLAAPPARATCTVM